MSNPVEITAKGFQFAHGEQLIYVPIEYVFRQKIGMRGDLLARALKQKSRQKILWVVDATAGLCRDSMHLLALGHRVTALEHNKQLFEAFARLPPPPNFHLVHAEAASWLADLADGKRPDVVFLDPMFPDKKKSAAVGKESLLLQLLEAPPSAAQEADLLSAARAAALSRVVVKRALRAPWLAAEKPSHSHAGKAVRYDIYLVGRDGAK